MPYHTDLRLVFEALGGRQREFNWLITDLELNYYPPRLRNTSREQATWMEGAELSEIVNANDIQFIWGVLSGFRSEITIDISALNPRPFADDNRRLWSPEVAIQHPLAEVEIVCWDSGATLFLTHDDDLSRRFREFFPEAVDLNDYNRRLALKP